MQLQLLPAVAKPRKPARTPMRYRRIIPKGWRLPLIATARSASVGRFIASFAECTPSRKFDHENK
jgi:hypothetical protein